MGYSRKDRKSGILFGLLLWASVELLVLSFLSGQKGKEENLASSTFMCAVTFNLLCPITLDLGQLPFCCWKLDLLD
jgi:hypothetical protein